MIELDPARVEPITLALSNIVRDHLAQPPNNADQVFEVLNALAITTAMVLAGTVKNGVDSGAIAFFETAVDQQMLNLGAKPILNFPPTTPKGH